MFSEEQRDVLHETLEWSRHNNRWQPCGTTACIAGYIVYITRFMLEEGQSFSEEIRDYADDVLDIPEEVSEWLFAENRPLVDIIDCLEEALKDNHW